MARHRHLTGALRGLGTLSRRNTLIGCFVVFVTLLFGTTSIPRAEAHTFDTSSHQTRTRNTSGVTFNHTCASGTTLLTLTLVVGGTTARTGGAPTYNGVALTQADQNGQAPSGAETIVELWYLLNPGTGSSYQINIPDSNNVYLTANASSYKATSGYRTVLKTDDDDGNTSTNPTGPSLTGLASGDVLVAVVGSGATTWAPSARTGTQLYDVDDGSYGDGAQYLIKSDSSDTAMGWTFGTSDDWSVVEAAFTEISPIEQEGFRFRNDDGSESAATWMQNQDTDASQDKNTNVRLRMLLDTPSDPVSIPFRLEYKKSTDSIYKKVLASESGSSTHTFVNSKRWKGNGSPSARAFDCGTDATLLVLTIVGAGTTQRAGGTPTYNGIAMTQADQTRGGATGYETSAELWYLINPPSGANTISVPNTGAITLYATASSYSAGAGYTSAFDASGFSESTAGANPSVSVSASVAGDVYVAVLGDGLATAPTARTGTALAEVDDGAYSDNHQYYIKAGTGSQTISWTIASDDYAMVVAAFKVVAISQPILLGSSSYISAGGSTNTTAQLTAPSGKTTSNFTAGRIQDDTNPSNSVDIANNFYTEMEWSVTATNTATTGDVYQFRITRNGTPLSSYTVTPQLTITGAATISIQGGADGSNGATVKVAVNGNIQGQTGTISSGSWTISNVAEPSSGDVVTVWIDSVSDSAEGIGITKYAGSNITGMVLNALTLSLGSSDNQTLSNANISQYDNSFSSNEDIFYDVDGNNDLAVCSASGSTGCTLSILSGNTYRPDSGSSGNITATNLSNAGTLTLDSNTLYISGTLTSSGTFNANTSTVNFNGSGSQTIPALNYYSLTSSSTGARVLASSGTIGISNTFTPGSNSYTVSGSTMNFDGSSAQTVNADFTYNNLQVQPSANTITTNFAAGTVTVGGDLTIGNGTNTSVVVSANNASTTLTVAGSVSISANTTLQANASNALTIGNDFTNNGTFTHNNGTVIFNDNSNTSSLNYSANTTFYGFTVSTGGKAMQFDESQGTIVTGTLTVQGTDCTTGRVFLDSTVNDNQWDITTTGATVNIDYADIEDSNAITTGITADNSTADNDNNTNWTVNEGTCTAGSTTSVYYSVGQNTSNHCGPSGDGNSCGNVSITSGTATFTASQAGTNLGIGDELVAGGNTYYLKTKTDTTHWEVITKLGVMPSDLSSTTVTSISHAFSSLSSAISGAVDSSHLNTTDLTSGNYILNIPCYYDTGADTTGVTINGYTTGSSNYIRVYTPYDTSSEVNQTQRHSGVWDDTKYVLYRTVTANNQPDITINEPYVRIEGLQLRNSTISYDNIYGIIALNSGVVNGSIYISGNIIRGNGDNSWYDTGIGDGPTDNTLFEAYIYNNIIYDVGDSNHTRGGITFNPNTSSNIYIYNNTIANCYLGINRVDGNFVAKNNIVYGSGNSNAYVGTFASGTDYNATDGTDNIGQGSNNRTSQTFSFTNAGSDNFHLESSDAGAIDHGEDLSSDTYLPFSIDIDSETRSGTWDIGADEYVNNSNSNPNSPASLTQKDSGSSSITESAWTTTNTPKLGFTITDPDSDTVKYEVQVATDSGFSSLILDYTHGSFSASGTTFEFIVGTYGSGSCSGTCPSVLSDSSTGYWWRVKAIDANSAESAYAEFGVAGTVDFKVDATAPTGGTVNDGTGGDEDWNDGTLTSLSSNWSGFDANVSGLNKYEYAIRRTSDNYYWSVCSGAGSWQASANWCNNSTSTSYTQSNLNLATGTIYYTSVRATDNAGNIGAAVSSNGEQVLPTLSFSLSTNTITFSNLNNGNSYTDTKTLTVTTSTNASSGYTVKAYNTADLTSLENPSDTVSNFYGNWSTPLTWSGGTYGFGYTSSDTDVQGSNRFGSGTKYAAFTQSSPGDVVADHTDTINGSSGTVSNEQFTVTYKVSVSNAQPAATYQTTSVYIVTANY